MRNLKEGDANMGVSKFGLGRNFLARAEHDSDIIGFVTDFAKENGVMTAIFTAIGALKYAKLGFYDQEGHEYLETSLSSPQEIASCLGNVSIREAKPFVHAHAVLVDSKGNTNAGHLLEGKVFAAEIHIFELVGKTVVRKNDAVTGLFLWDI